MTLINFLPRYKTIFKFVWDLDSYEESLCLDLSIMNVVFIVPSF